MIYLINWCAFPMCILPWLLSGLLGLLAGYLLWARWKARYQEAMDEISSWKSKYSKLEGELKDCSHHRAVLEGDISTANGRVKEMQAKLDASLADSAATKKSGFAADADATKKSGFAADATKKSGLATDKLGDAADKAGDLASGFAAGAVSGGTGTGGDTSGSASGSSSGNFGSLKSSNLQIIEGIGPKMETVLHEAGIKTWTELAGKSPADLRALLGDKYKIINPDTWPQQASLARDGKWEELITLQKQLDTGAATNINLTDSKLEKLMLKSAKGGFGKYKENDLKIVEGIGPKIAELLNNAGITTWAGLADSTPAKIQEILDAAGSKFSLAKPGTWPQQAVLAATGKWSELQELQDRLDGGK